MKSDYCVVMTTFSDDENGQLIINSLMKEHLAACIQVQAIKSYYRWQGQVHCDEEKQVLIKTKQSLYSEVEANIRAHHAYETPEIIQLPITKGFIDYLDWLDDECK